MLEMKLRRHDAPSYRAAVLAFPAAEPDLQKAMDEIGVGDTTEKLEELLRQSESPGMEMGGMRL